MDKYVNREYDLYLESAQATLDAVDAMEQAVFNGLALARSVYNSDGYEYPSYKQQDLRAVRSLLTRVVLDAVTGRARNIARYEANDAT